MTTTLHTFARNDRVRLVDNSGMVVRLFPLGRTGVVREEPRSGFNITVTWDDNESVSYVRASRLEKVEPEPKSRYSSPPSGELLFCTECGCLVGDRKIHDNNAHWDAVVAEFPDLTSSLTLSLAAESFVPPMVEHDPLVKVIEILKAAERENSVDWAKSNYGSIDYYRFAGRNSLLIRLTSQIKELRS